MSFTLMEAAQGSILARLLQHRHHQPVHHDVDHGLALGQGQQRAQPTGLLVQVCACSRYCLRFCTYGVAYGLWARQRHHQR
jgi:hypothetical protein